MVATATGLGLSSRRGFDNSYCAEGKWKSEFTLAIPVECEYRGTAARYRDRESLTEAFWYPVGGAAVWLFFASLAYIFNGRTPVAVLMGWLRFPKTCREDVQGKRSEWSKCS